MNVEICTDCLAGALAAEKYGAKRIELCSALSVGGLTPSFGTIEQCAERTNVEVHVMIRHREGDFKYDVEDQELMKIDIVNAKKAGAKGVVFGILDENNEVSDLNIELVEISKLYGLEATFHRAFDQVYDHKSEIKKIIKFGFDRLLTAGLRSTAIEGVNVIRELQKNHGHLIQIMAGSGIIASNVLEICDTGINNIHFTARKSSTDKTKFSMGKRSIVDEDKIKNIIGLFASK